MNAWMRKTAALLLAITAPVQAQTTVYYIHTDALGSVVAETDANRNVVERREYEPYGAQLTPVLADGPGYTGHVQDAATGLVYMQQRYYDPMIGRFLSVDPVAANASTGASFNRYVYAVGNPFKFTDPDGRDALYFASRQAVVIPVHFSGPGATVSAVASIVQRAESVRSEDWGLASVHIVPMDSAGPGVNSIVLGSGPDYVRFAIAGEGANAIGGNYAYINAQAVNFEGAAVHDALHLAGAPEGYLYSGYQDSRVKTNLPGYTDSHIMADRGGTALRSRDVNAIIGNETTRHVGRGEFQGVFGVDGRIDSAALKRELSR